MKNLPKLAFIGAASLVVATDGYAQSTNSPGKFFVSADVGAAFEQDIAIQGNSAFLIGPGMSNIKFDTGVHAGATFGYNLNDSFALDFEAGFIRNTINQIGTDTFSGGGNASLEQIPLLLNAVYTLPLKGPFKPYVGLGIGASVGIFNSDGVPGSYNPFGSTTKYNDTDVAFVGQVELGCKYVLTKNIELGVAYKFLGTTDHSWTDNSIPLKTAGTMTHVIGVNFTWRF